MIPPAIRIAMAGCLFLGALGAVGAMTPEQKKDMVALTADSKAMWEMLPALASDARNTAMLIKDLEAFANLPARLVEGDAEAAQRNSMAATAWLKENLPKQYLKETGNSGIKGFSASSQGVQPCLIPKTMHFIWLGSRVPEKYVANIGAIAKLNQDYQVNVWLDDQSSASADAIPGQGSRIRHVDQILEHAVASEEARAIYRLAVSRSGSRPNFAAASDVLRILILLAEGGVYLDTDTGIDKPEAACGFGQLRAKYGFLVSTQTLQRDGQFNNSPMAAVAGSAALRELLALSEKRYRDAAHSDQPACGQGPGSQSWLYWVAAGSGNDLRLSSTVFLCGPVLVADYLSRLGHGWLRARNIELEAHIQPGPPAVEWFTEGTRRVAYHGASGITPVEDYFFIDTVYGDFDLTSETFGLSHKFDNSWLSASSSAAPVETKESGSAVSAGRPAGSAGQEGKAQAGSQPVIVPGFPPQSRC